MASNRMQLGSYLIDRTALPQLLLSDVGQTKSVSCLSSLQRSGIIAFKRWSISVSICAAWWTRSANESYNLGIDEAEAPYQNRENLSERLRDSRKPAPVCLYRKAFVGFRQWIFFACPRAHYRTIASWIIQKVTVVAGGPLTYLKFRWYLGVYRPQEYEDRYGVSSGFLQSSYGVTTQNTTVSGWPFISAYSIPPLLRFETPSRDKLYMRDS